MVENNTFLEFIEKLINSPTSFRITTLQSRGLKKFLKQDVENEQTEEIVDSNKLKVIIDMEKLINIKNLLNTIK